MKVLIIGVSGFIGEELLDYLKENYEVYGISRSNVNKINCFQLDVTNYSQLSAFFEEHSFEIIINLACKMSKPDEILNFNVLNINLKIYQNLIKVFEKNKPKTLINFSSSSVYPNIDGFFCEESLVDPSHNNDCLYGLSKLCGEVLFNFFLKNKLRLINLRIGYVHGQKMGIKKIHKVFEKELLSSNKITLYGNGQRILPQIEIKSLIKYIDFFIKNNLSGTYNIIDENISTFEISERIIKSIGNKDSEILMTQKGNSNKFKINNSKILKVIEKNN